MDTIKLLLTLLNIPMIGKKRAVNILRNYQSGVDLINLIQLLYPVLSISEKELKKAELLSLSIIERSGTLNIKILSFNEPAYPSMLRSITDYPPLMFIRGNLSLLNQPLSAALIGSRRSGSYSLNMTALIGEILSSRGFNIISGLALGCDRTAHLSALKENSGTIAVMPCGPNIIYPRDNRILHRDILRKKGTIVSEYAPDTHPAPFRFIERDWLQSGLSHIVILIGSSLTGGSMHTAYAALKQNRPLFVFRPWRFSAEYSGNQYLIEHKRVHAFGGPEDFLNILKKILPDIRDCNRESDQLLFPYV